MSHDRYFLDTVVNDVAEIDRAYPGGLFRVEGSYSRFLEKKEEFLLAQSNRQEALANRVQREVEWLRRGAKARTGKSKARIDDAGRLMRELGDLETRTAKGVTQIDFTATDRRTKRLLSVENITKELGGRTLFRDLSFTLSPGTRLGLLGLNGTGKTTLLRILSGEIGVDSGTVETRRRAAHRLLRSGARAARSRADAAARGSGAHGDTVMFQDRPIHVAGWAKRFLFDSGQLDRPMSSLSGGEQARVLIARLMLQPADLLLLDEPTNDLDIPTLEVLEDSLTEFPGRAGAGDARSLPAGSRVDHGAGAGWPAAARRCSPTTGSGSRRRWARPSGEAGEAGESLRRRSRRRRSSLTMRRASGSRWKRALWKQSSRSRRSARKCIRRKWSPTARVCRPAMRACSPRKRRCTLCMRAGRSWKRSSSKRCLHSATVEQVLLEQKVSNLALPFVLDAALRQQENVLNGRANPNVTAHFENAGHCSIHDSTVRVGRDG